jgi:prepilin-type processing-associated H-X9-DG protein
MYKVRGIDQKEYGPVSAEVVQRWIKEGRANGQTLLQAEGSNEWKPAAQFPEFSAALAAGRSATAPPIPEGLPPIPRTAGSRLSGLAIASLVLGVLALPTCGITGFIGLPMGLVALRRIRQSKGQLTGRGLALAGIGVSAVFLMAGLGIQTGLWWPMIQREKAQRQSMGCRAHLQELGQALRKYANDHGDRYPFATNWCDVLRGRDDSPQAFVCPAASAGPRSTYAYNAKLSGLEEPQVTPKTVMLFEIEGGWNVSGGPDLMLQRPRHGSQNVCFADGSVETVAPERLGELRWDP